MVLGGADPRSSAVLFCKSKGFSLFSFIYKLVSINWYQSRSDPKRFFRCAGNFGMTMVADLIPRFDGREAYWWLIQAEQYFGSRMSEEMKLEWAVAFALRGDALDWWISWKESHPNTYWWNFVKAILKKFQPEV